MIKSPAGHSPLPGTRCRRALDRVAAIFVRMTPPRNGPRSYRVLIVDEQTPTAQASAARHRNLAACGRSPNERRVLQRAPKLILCQDQSLRRRRQFVLSASAEPGVAAHRRQLLERVRIAFRRRTQHHHAE